jgi:hypothetical protein
MGPQCDVTEKDLVCIYYKLRMHIGWSGLLLPPPNTSVLGGHMLCTSLNRCTSVLGNLVHIRFYMEHSDLRGCVSLSILEKHPCKLAGFSTKPATFWKNFQHRGVDVDLSNMFCIALIICHYQTI